MAAVLLSPLLLFFSFFLSSPGNSPNRSGESPGRTKAFILQACAKVLLTSLVQSLVVGLEGLSSKECGSCNKGKALVALTLSAAQQMSLHCSGRLPAALRPLGCCAVAQLAAAGCSWAQSTALCLHPGAAARQSPGPSSSSLPASPRQCHPTPPLADVAVCAVVAALACSA